MKLRELEVWEMEEVAGGDMVIYTNNGDGTATKFYLVGDSTGFDYDPNTNRPTNLIADRVFGPEIVPEREVAQQMYRSGERETYSPGYVTYGW